MPRLVNSHTGGSFGVIEDLTNAAGVGSRVISITTDTSLNIFRSSTITSNPLFGNYFNMFQFVTADANNKFKYASFGSKKHVIGGRRKGCTWNPKNCSMDFTNGEVTLCELEVQEEHCPDEVWNSCWANISGHGLDKDDFYATPEGTALIRLMVDSTFEAIGNGITDLVWYGSHPIIELADEGKWYEDCGITQTEWECFIDQQRQCGGLLTLVDALKADKINNYNVDIGSFSGSTYTDSATDLFDRLIARKNTKMRTHDKRAGKDQGRSYIQVSLSIYNKYKQELTENFAGIPEQYYLFLKGEDNTCSTCPATSVRGVLEYDGYYIICMDEWDMLGEMTCTYTHRAILTVPRNYVIAGHSNQLSGQNTGMGMTILQRLGAPFKGKVYMNAAFEMGTAIADQDFLINASDWERVEKTV